MSPWSATKMGTEIVEIARIGSDGIFAGAAFGRKHVEEQLG